MVIYLFSEYITPRLKYTLKLLEEITHQNFKIVESLEAFNKISGAKINYSIIRLSNCLNIKPHNILFEDFIRDIKPKFTTLDKKPVLFENNCDLGFDILSAVFYLVSRYEEYITNSIDKHGRFVPEKSIQFKYLDRPLVNEWAEMLLQKLNIKQNNILYYKSLPTFDIDNAYAYLGKTVIRLLLASVRNIIKLNFKELFLRIRVVLNIEDDPSDNYNYLLSLKKRFVFFFLLKSKGKNNTAINPAGSKKYNQLIKEISNKQETGLHPSYNCDKATLISEKNQLESIIESKVVKSRYHYLKYNIPESYEALLQANIYNDYSMGYANKPGFRAGIANPFYFFNLRSNEETKLKIHPFCIMDSMFVNKNEKYIFDSYKKYMKINKEAGGTFISVFHDRSLSENENGLWRKVLEMIS